MLKKAIVGLFSLILLSTCYASDFAQIKIRIKDPTRLNNYFLCLYGVGCLSIHAGSNGKVFPVAPIDIGNIRKIVITDARNMSMYAQASANSCNVMLKSNQQLTITGTLVVRNNVPYINGLSCRIA